MHAFQRVAVTASELTYLVDLNGDVLGMNAAAADRAETSLAVDQPPDFMRDPFMGEALARIAAGDDQVAFRFICSDADGTPVHVRVQRLQGTAGVIGLVTVALDVHTSFRDALTGLADRRAIAERLAAWRGESGGERRRHAVLFLDLDGFKRINDAYGHAIGDRVLSTVAQRLLHCVREGDLVVRYGGDEFVLLLKGVASAADAEPVLERIRGCAEVAIEVDAHSLHVSAAIGLAIGELAEGSVEEAIDAADRDMYARKGRKPR